MTTNADDHADERTTVLSKDYEEQRVRKGKAKIVFVSKEPKEEGVQDKKKKAESDHEKKRCFVHVPREIRPALRYPQPNFENPNGASTSSPLTFEDRIAMVMNKPPSPTYQSSPSSRLTERKIPKRCLESQRSIDGGFKKPKVASFYRTATTREMPSWLVQVMRDMNAQDPKLIFEKALFKTDVNPSLSRLLMPFNRLITNDFLTPDEWIRSITEEEENIDIDNDEKIGVGAILIDPRSEKWGVVLKRWEMMNYSENRSWSYSLTCGWNDIVKANELKVGDNILVWSFRCRGILCFALVTMRQSSCSSSLPL